MPATNETKFVRVQTTSCFFAFFLSSIAVAQSPNLDDVFHDFLIIMDRYNEPAAEASTMQTGAGYYTTAKSLKKFEFAVSIGLSGLPFPDKKQSFAITDQELLNFDIRDGEDATIPSALGGEKRVFFDFEIAGDQYEFQAIGGLGTDFFAFPYVQGHLGLWKETELIIRYGPKITIENSDYALYGAGVKHNLSQYIFKDSRPIEIAFLGNINWSDFNLRYERLALEPASGDPPIAVIDGTLIDYYSVNTGLIASKDYGSLEFSGGLIYTNSWIDYKLTGDEGQFLNIFNQVLRALSERKTSFKVDLGTAYNWGKWTLASQISISEFVNFNLQGVYKIF